MKKYDVRYSQGFDRSHSWRYEQRVEVESEEEAKKIIIDKCKQERPDEKVMNIRVKEAQDFICYTYSTAKIGDGKTIAFIKNYYTGYMDLPMFGKTVIFESKKESAKRFRSEQELKQEIKSLGRKISDFKIEKVEVNE